MAGRSSPTQLSRQSESDRPERTKELPAKGTDAARDCENIRCVLQSSVQRKEQEMNDPAVVEGIGFAAAGLVLTTFYMRSMIALRWVAIASNLAFIAYGYLDNLPPVLLLHLLLLPLNIFRLAQLRQRRIGAVWSGIIPLTPCIRTPLRRVRFVGSSESVNHTPIRGSFANGQSDITNSTTGRNRWKRP